MSMLLLCTNYNFSGCVKKGTNLVIRVDSKLFDRQNKPASGQASQRTSQPADKPASGQASQRTNILQIDTLKVYGNHQQNNFD